MPGIANTASIVEAGAGVPISKLNGPTQPQQSPNLNLDRFDSYLSPRPLCMAATDIFFSSMSNFTLAQACHCHGQPW